MFTFLISAQKIEDKSVLEKRKKETIEQIEFTRKLLEQTRKSAQLNLNQVNLLNRNISNREKLIDELNEEIKYLEVQLEQNKDTIRRIEADIKMLISEYEKIIRATYRNLDRESYFEYILGAQDLNQSYHRLKQIKYINNLRKRIYNDLIDSRELLYRENLQMEQTLLETRNLHGLKESELNMLSRDKAEKQVSINKLRTQERMLSAEIAEKQNLQKKIELEITKIIEEEIRRAKARNTAVLTPADKVLSGDFMNNRGKLPWPVERGIVTGHFGEHNHPVLKNVKITSNGIDISSIEGSRVRCIFDGEVTKVIAFLGANYTVMIRHGDFYTVYNNLINISVKAGDIVKKNEFIGSIYTDSNKSTKLHFQIWKDKNPQDPEKWLSK